MFFPSSDFPWTRDLEESYPAIREEFEALDRRRLRRWPETKVYNHGWEAFGLYGYGQRLNDNCALCPRLASVLDALPSITMAGFSVLGPGTVIKPHCGYTTTVVRCHLGIIVPDSCGLRVGSETRTWREGECFVFDDTIEHEAWNHAESSRVVLLLDVVKPGATFDAEAGPGAQLVRYFGSTPSRA